MTRKYTDSKHPILLERKTKLRQNQQETKVSLFFVQIW